MVVDFETSDLKGNEQASVTAKNDLGSRQRSSMKISLRSVTTLSVTIRLHNRLGSVGSSSIYQTKNRSEFAVAKEARAVRQGREPALPLSLLL